MLDQLRLPVFLLSVLSFLLVVLVETGAGLFLPVSSPDLAQMRASITREGVEPPDDATLREHLRVRQEQPPRPGYALTALVLGDGLLLLTLALMAIALVLPERVHGRVQGAATFILSLAGLIGGVTAIIALIVLLTVMLGLFLAPPFGLIAYLAVWGFFERDAARMTASLLMLLKLAGAICLVLAQQRFLQNKGLVLLVLTSLLSSVIVSWLHGFPPGVLVSIADVVAALIVLVLGSAWAVFFLVSSVVAVVKSLRFESERA